VPPTVAPDGAGEVNATVCEALAKITVVGTDETGA